MSHVGEPGGGGEGGHVRFKKYLVLNCPFLLCLILN
jgi:hypothetical protein